jgi:hypothetical protein
MSTFTDNFLFGGTWLPKGWEPLTQGNYKWITHSQNKMSWPNFKSYHPLVCSLIPRHFWVPYRPWVFWAHTWGGGGGVRELLVRGTQMSNFNVLFCLNCGYATAKRLGNAAIDNFNKVINHLFFDQLYGFWRSDFWLIE